jgi:hypothetical protein
VGPGSFHIDEIGRPDFVGCLRGLIGAFGGTLVAILNVLTQLVEHKNSQSV